MDYKFFFRQIALTLWSPRKAWTAFSESGHPAVKTRNNILLPMLALVAICAFLGSILFSNVNLHTSYSVITGIKYFLLDIIVIWISALLLREITRALDLKAEFSLSFTLIVYSLIPFFVCQMASLLFESLAFVDILALYGMWIFWSGAEIMLNPPSHKKMPMLIAIFIIIAELYIGGSIAISSVLERIYFGFFAR